MVGRMAGRQTAGLGERGDRVRPAARSFAQQVGSGSGGKWRDGDVAVSWTRGYRKKSVGSRIASMRGQRSKSPTKRVSALQDMTRKWYLK